MVVMMVVKERRRRCVCRARYKEMGLNLGQNSRQLSLLVQVYVDLRELAGLMIGRIRNINKKGQLGYVMVVS